MTVVTGKGIEMYRLAVIKSALKLEMAGLKGRFSALKVAKTITGSKSNDRATQLSLIQKILDEAKQEAVDQQNYGY